MSRGLSPGAVISASIAESKSACVRSRPSTATNASPFTIAPLLSAAPPSASETTCTPGFPASRSSRMIPSGLVSETVYSPSPPPAIKEDECRTTPTFRVFLSALGLRQKAETPTVFPSAADNDAQRATRANRLLTMEQSSTKSRSEYVASTPSPTREERQLTASGGRPALPSKPAATSPSTSADVPTIVPCGSSSPTKWHLVPLLHR